MKGFYPVWEGISQVYNDISGWCKFLTINERSAVMVVMVSRCPPQFCNISLEYYK